MELQVVSAAGLSIGKGRTGQEPSNKAIPHVPASAACDLSERAEAGKGYLWFPKAKPAEQSSLEK